MSKKVSIENPNNNNNNKRKRKEVAIFGNYRNYYGYRVGQDLDEDPRLKVFKQEWFEGKDCLDIGCNSGSITIAIAKKFGCRSILGIDIDGDRVQDACWTLRRTVRVTNSQNSPKISQLENTEVVKDAQHAATGSQKEETNKSMGANSQNSPKISQLENTKVVKDAQHAATGSQKEETNKSMGANSQNSPKISQLENTEVVKDAQHAATGSQKEETNKSTGADSVPEGKDLFNIVTFQKGNFVQNWRSPDDKCYHTILCLSVSKWIHLNWGDDGLITLFSKVWKLLHPGGVFILEPQPWESYYKNRLVSEVSQTNYRDIKIYPDSFQEILLDKIGFRTVENITSRLSGTKAGFARPILAFWK